MTIMREPREEASGGINRMNNAKNLAAAYSCRSQAFCLKCYTYTDDKFAAGDDGAAFEYVSALATGMTGL